MRLLRLGVAYLVMEVGPHRRTRITRSGDLLAARHAKLVGRADYVDPTASEAVPLGEDEVGDILAEPRQMAVNGGSAVGMGDVKRKAVPRRRLQNARHVTVGRRHDRLALHAVGLQIDARVEMVGAHLAEIGRVVTRHVAQRIFVIFGIEPLRRSLRHERQGGYNGKNSASSHGSSILRVISSTHATTSSVAKPSEMPCRMSLVRS